MAVVATAVVATAVAAAAVAAAAAPAQAAASKLEVLERPRRDRPLAHPDDLAVLDVDAPVERLGARAALHGDNGGGQEWGPQMTTSEAISRVQGPAMGSPSWAAKTAHRPRFCNRVLRSWAGTKKAGES